jgi:hypothetical protein
MPTILLPEIAVSAQPTGLWTPIKVSLTGYTHIEIVVLEGQTWRFGPAGEMCGPGGIRKRGQDCLCATAPVGALIGKFNGSDVEDTTPPPPGSISTSNPSVPTFAVGSFCRVAVPANDLRPCLFLTINDSVTSFSSHSGQILVQIRAYSRHESSSVTPN